MEHLLQKSKCSIFPNIFKYVIFKRGQKVSTWSKGLKPNKMAKLSPHDQLVPKNIQCQCNRDNAYHVARTRPICEAIQIIMNLHHCEYVNNILIPFSFCSTDISMLTENVLKF